MMSAIWDIVFYTEFSCILLCFRLDSFHCSYMFYVFIVYVSVCIQ